MAKYLEGVYRITPIGDRTCETAIIPTEDGEYELMSVPFPSVYPAVITVSEDLLDKMNPQFLRKIE